MTTETETATAESKPETANANSSPSIDLDKHIALARQAAIEAVKDKLDATEKRTREVEDKYENQNKRLLAALRGESDKPDVNPLTLSLLTDPEAVLNTYADVVMERTLGKISDTATEAKQVQEAARELLAERPDIARSQTAQAFIMREYKLLEKSKKSSKEKMTEALRSFDLFAEDHGLGEVGERVKKAQSVPSGTASVSPKAPRGNNVETGKKYLEDRQKHWRQTRGLET